MEKMNPLEKCEKCPDFIFEDVQAYIQQLEEQNAELVRKTEQLQSSMDQVQEALWDNGFGSLEELLQAYSQVQRERDAAVKILTDVVHINEWLGDIDICSACKKDNCKKCRRCNEGFEWRGVPEPPKEETP